MTEQTYDFRIVFAKLAEVETEVPEELEGVSEADIHEYDEIRELREMVMEIQTRPQVFFVTT